VLVTSSVPLSPPKFTSRFIRRAKSNSSRFPAAWPGQRTSAAFSSNVVLDGYCLCAAQNHDVNICAGPTGSARGERQRVPRLVEDAFRGRIIGQDTSELVVPGGVFPGLRKTWQREIEERLIDVANELAFRAGDATVAVVLRTPGCMSGRAARCI
jgi:hypothetical protein